MADTVTPLASVRSKRRSAGYLLRTPAHTPYRTPDVRRFGPLGSSWRTPGAPPLSRRRTSTPVTRNSRQRTVTTPTEIEEQNIKALTLKVWHVYRISPLYNLRTKKSDLQHYSRVLSSHVAAENKKGTFVDTSEPGDAVIGYFSGLDTDIEDPKSLLIEIKGKQRHKTEEKVLCQAVLFSTDLQYNPLQQHDMENEFTCYTSMLIRGPIALSETVQNWIEVQFDCKVVKQTFTSQEMAFMTAMFTGFNEVHKPVELVYKVPGHVEGLSTINYSTSADDCLRLWKQIKSADDDTFTSEEAAQFMAGLETHFYEIFRIKLNALQLSTVGTSVAFIGEDGKLKLQTKSSENVLKVLRHLTDLALDQLKIT